MKLSGLTISLLLSICSLSLSVNAELVRILDGRGVGCTAPVDYATDGWRAISETTSQNTGLVQSQVTLQFLTCTANGWQSKSVYDSIFRKTLSDRPMEIRIKEVIANITSSSNQLIKAVKLSDQRILDINFSAETSQLLSDSEQATLEKEGQVMTRVDIGIISVYETFVDGISQGENRSIGGSFGVRVNIRK